MKVLNLCNNAGMSRQNYYKTRKVRQYKQVDVGLVKHLVEKERALQPRLGGLKLYSMLGSELRDAGIKLGRDRFFDALRKHDLLLEPLPKAPRTTNSSHNLPVFTNLIKDMKQTKPNQVWISDITYIRARESFSYLSLVTDKYSRKIVGYHLGKTLEAKDTLKALDVALKGLPKEAKLIHHSDRGSQYCCHEYVGKLKSKKIQVSMTETNHCAENAQAERVNGILKQEYFLNCEFRNYKQAKQAVKEAVHLYNTRRPHRSLNLSTPEEVHRLVA